MRLTVLLLAILNAAVLVWTLWFTPPRTEPRPPPAGGDLEPVAGAPACDEPRPMAGVRLAVGLTRRLTMPVQELV